MSEGEDQFPRKEILFPDVFGFFLTSAVLLFHILRFDILFQSSNLPDLPINSN